MVRGRSGTKHSVRSPVGARPVEAVTCDAWYTIIYMPPRSRDEVGRRRVRAWVDPMVRRGVEPSRARATVEELYTWARGAEALGRTPRVAAQVGWVERRIGRKLPGEEIQRGIDGALLSADVRPAPGVRAVLRSWQEDGVALGVVSNILYETGEAATRILEGSGLASMFDALYLSCDHRWAKPRPEPFRWVLHRLRARPGRSCHIGDLGFDVVGASRAGMVPLLFTGLHRWERPRPVIPPTFPGSRVVRSWAQAPSAVSAALRASPASN